MSYFGGCFDENYGKSKAVMDYIPLNQETNVEVWPITNIEEVLHGLSKY